MRGSLMMLIAIVYLAGLYQQTNRAPRFDLLQLYDLAIPLGAQRWLFAAFALAFAIKVPMFPLHTWLPDAHVEAPTGGSGGLVGGLLHVGSYGFPRIGLPAFP